MQDQEHSADGKEDGEDPLRQQQRGGLLAVCHLGHDLVDAGLEKDGTEGAVDNGDDGNKNLLAGDIQSVKHQREADEAAIAGAESAAHHDQQNEEVDAQLLRPGELAVREVANTNVCEGDDRNEHENYTGDDLFAFGYDVHELLVSFQKNQSFLPF